MKLKWYGQAAFSVKADSGVTVMTDPYTPETAGYVPILEPADLVVTSSDNDSFHCRADLIQGNPIAINALAVAQDGGTRTEKGVTIRAIEAMEALNHRYHDPDQNAMYRFEIDGISVGHMGDVGNAFSEAQIDFFRGVDVFLALAGGHPTIELDDLKVVLDAVKPRLIVPMHFRTLRLKPRNQYWIQTFLDYFPAEQVDWAFNSEITLHKADLPESTRVLVMSYVS
ncbi:MAG TPA: MBL fold metallo-hydrolase [Phototrophicaceae bacterium]|nr:MBL fold metallo-hydrolase [Phototrophicaceae bacterium]